MPELDIPQADDERRLERIETLLDRSLEMRVGNGVIRRDGDGYHAVFVSEDCSLVGLVAISGDGTVGNAWTRRKCTGCIPWDLKRAADFVDRYIGAAA